MIEEWLVAMAAISISNKARCQFFKGMSLAALGEIALHKNDVSNGVV